MNEKGFTGVDITISIIVIFLFLGIIMTVFYHVYLTTARINREATANSLIIEIFEKMEAMDYEKVKEGTVEVIGEYLNETVEDHTTMDVIRKVKIPKGYRIQLEITNYNQTEGNKGKEDIIKIANLKIIYQIGKQEKEIAIQTMKERNKKYVNPPVLIEGMVPVKWQDSQWIETITSDPEWYDYKQTRITGENTSKWANAKTKDGSIWVWIPRYSYCINSGYHCNGLNKKVNGTTEEAGEIEIKFLKGTTDEYYKSNGKADRKPILNDQDSTKATKMNNFIVHPSFTANAEAGGWDKEITGFWAAKYETSKIDATSLSQGNNNIPKVQAGVLPWTTYLSIDDAFRISKNMNDKNRLSRDLIEPHLIKNSEWGAIAYLAHSQYGLNQKQMEINDTGFISGNAGNGSSTTGNETGVFDMRGGTSEYVAAYNRNADVTKIENLVNETQIKYKEVYDSYSNKRYGDAFWETSSNVNGQFSWFSNFTYDAQFFKRGGYYKSTNRSGLFCVTYDDGTPSKPGANDFDGFRIILTIP